MIFNTCLAKSLVKYLIAPAILIPATLSITFIDGNEAEFFHDFLEGSY